MTHAWFDTAVAWISANPVAAGGLIFLIALCDALVVVGIIVPALPLLFAIGALIGLGHISGPYAIACAALGAFLGDAISYWVGLRVGPQMVQRWPFSRYPQLLSRGDALLRRQGMGAILIARFVGAVRPFVPATAGMLRMPLRRYAPASLFACVLWAACFLGPGWLFGASYAAVAAVADRLALVLGALVLLLALVWATVLYSYRWFNDHANTLLAQALRWTRAHPRLGRYAAALIDPNRPESASLVILAVSLLAIGWAWFALLAAMLLRGEPLLVDRNVYEAMLALRNPLADAPMAALASIGDAAVLVPAALTALAWLTWRRRWNAAAHWLAALAFGLALTALLGAVVDMPRPPTAAHGFGFPAIGVTMATITFGFFAVLIARELPGRRRVWPYLLGGVLVSLLGFSRLYLGAHWLSDVVGGVLFGIVWLLVLGIAYRRHVSRSFSMRPLAGWFYGVFVVAALWQGPHAAQGNLLRFAAPESTLQLDADAWWQGQWAILPAQRKERDVSRRWPLDIQVAGPLEPLAQALVAQGWAIQPQADWAAALGLLDDDTPVDRVPVLPATLDTDAEALLLRRPGKVEGQTEVLRLWRAPGRLADGTPLWIGSTQALRRAHPLGLVSLWLPLPDDGHTHAAVRAALHEIPGVAMAASPHPQSSTTVLRVRIPPAPHAPRHPRDDPNPRP